MELTIQTKTLSRLVARAGAATSERSPTALMKCIMLTAEKSGVVSTSGTDTVLSITTRGTAEVKTGGKLALNAKRLAEIAKALPAGDAKLKLKADKLTVSAGKSTFTVPVLPPEDFPTMPKAEGAMRLSMASKTLAQLLAASAYARSKDDDKETHIACVRLERTETGARCVGLDRKRFAIAELPGADATDWTGDSLAARGIADVQKACADFADEDVEIFSPGGLDGQIHFVWQSLTISVARSGQDYLPYNTIVQNVSGKHVAEVTCARERLIEAVKRAALNMDVDTSGVHLRFSPGDLTVVGINVDGQASDSLDTDYAGEPWDEAVRADVLVEALQSIHDDEVILRIPGENRYPIIIVGAANPSAITVIIALVSKGA